MTIGLIPYEFEVKEILEESGIRVERSCLVARGKPFPRRCIETLPPPYVVKAQIRGWGRGKLGLIKFAENRDEVYNYAEELLDKQYGGKRIDYVLVSEKVEALRELYLSIMIDNEKREYMILASKYGGVDVEALAGQGKLLKIYVNPFEGVRDYMVRRLARFFEKDVNSIKNILYGMYNAVSLYDLVLLEINPLMDTGRELVAVDRKAIIDEEALSRNPLLQEIADRYLGELDPAEKEGIKRGFNLVKLDGSIAVIGNGAGLTMATLDLVVDNNGEPGVFLDLGGGADAERVASALSIVLDMDHIDKILINVLGGITRCDEVARGIVKAYKEGGKKKKMVIRLSGLNEEEGRRILFENGFLAYESIEEAVKEVVK